jgi:hypothetical protein
MAAWKCSADYFGVNVHILRSDTVNHRGLSGNKVDQGKIEYDLAPDPQKNACAEETQVL